MKLGMGSALLSAGRHVHGAVNMTVFVNIRGWIDGGSRSHFPFLRHAGRVLDVELLDRKFAGDEAW